MTIYNNTYNVYICVCVLNLSRSIKPATISYIWKCVSL